MDHTSEVEKYPAQCDGCGNIFVISLSSDGEYAMGTDDCPECGSPDFSEVEYTGDDA